MFGPDDRLIPGTPRRSPATRRQEARVYARATTFNDPCPRVYTVRADGRALKLITDGCHTMAWRGRRMAPVSQSPERVHSRDTLEVMPAAGGLARRITAGVPGRRIWTTSTGSHCRGRDGEQGRRRAMRAAWPPSPLPTSRCVSPIVNYGRLPAWLRSGLPSTVRCGTSASRSTSPAPSTTSTRFLAGGSTLRSFEVEEVGDVEGRTLVHPQCHFGLDTLSWARRGARVTGLDFSAPAMTAARKLAARAGLEADFVAGRRLRRGGGAHGRRFDLVYTGLGALNWLPDIERWARGDGERSWRRAAASTWPSFIRSSAVFADDDLTVAYSYFHAEPFVWDAARHLRGSGRHHRAQPQH